MEKYEVCNAGRENTCGYYLAESCVSDCCVHRIDSDVPGELKPELSL